MILVTGSTGKVGQPLITALQAKGVPFKALARSEASTKSLTEKGVTVVRGDLADLTSVKAALQGVDKLFLLSAGSRFSTLELPVIEAAKAAGVKHVVKLSAWGASADSANPLLREHGHVEQALEASGLAWTVLRPNFFMQNWVAFHSYGIQAGQPVYANTGDGRLGWIDARDIADVAATALTETGHEGFIYELTGPDSLSYAEVAAKLSTLLGRGVQHVVVPDAAAYQAILGMGMDTWYATGLTFLNQGVRHGAADRVLGTTELVTGKAPRTMDAFLQENLAAFQG